MKLTLRQIMAGSFLLIFAMSFASIGGIFLYRQIRAPDARYRCTKTQIETISAFVNKYAKNHGGKYPSTLADLLPTREDFDCIGNGNTIRDSWGKAFDYTIENGAYSLRSSGPDMIMGTKDDITN